MTLLEAHGVKLTKQLEFRGSSAWYTGAYGELPQNQKVGVFVELDNSEKSGLGMPLPKGTLRVYKADQSGAQQFVGEDAIESHAARRETPRQARRRVRRRRGSQADGIQGARQLHERERVGDRAQKSQRRRGHGVRHRARQRRLGDRELEPVCREEGRADVRVHGAGSGARRDQGELPSEGAMVLKTSFEKTRRGFRQAMCALTAGAALVAGPVRADTPTKVSGDADRKQVTITVYNQGFGLVREVRELKDLGKGRVALEFRDVACDDSTRNGSRQSARRRLQRARAELPLRSAHARKAARKVRRSQRARVPLPRGHGQRRRGRREAALRRQRADSCR